ncbi:MAG TPA: acyltransferase family protein [Acidimicrobiales bacterium]|nr:acyltransferase family protein [Acidimicrobiales bacterium]
MRALAVTAVIAYHSRYGWARGGYLGVDTFFVLSGFLITSLLLAEFARGRRIDLRAFWARRARRLLPALLVLLAAIAAYAAWWSPSDSRSAVRGDGIAALFYSANWHFIAHRTSYFDLFATPSLLEHTWSLAIEEQFYLLWPLVVGGCLVLARGRRLPLAAVASSVLVASAVLMARLVQSDPTRAYFGTDTRVHSLLVGALLAMILERRATRERGASRLASAAGAVALVAVLTAYARIGDHDLVMYRGGFLLFASVVAVVIVAAVQPRGPVRALLSLPALVWIGKISYGLYLWHWPVLLVMTPARTHLNGVGLDAARIAVTVGCATASYVLVELPIRRGDFLRGRIALPSAAVAVGAVATAVIFATASAVVPNPAFALPAPDTPMSFAVPSTVSAPTTLATRATLPDATALTVAPLTTAPPPHVIAVIGDSVAASLVPGLQQVSASRGIQVVNAAITGCGATDELSLDDQGRPFDWSANCVAAVPEVQRQVIDQTHPDLVIWLSSWETSDRLVGSERVRFGTPEGDASIMQGMTATLARVTADGARVAILTLPPRSAREDGRPVRDGATAFDHLNELLMEFAFAHADQVELVDFATIVCPAGPHCPTQRDGTWLRPDGMHFTDQSASLVAQPLLDIILARPG